MTAGLTVRVSEDHVATVEFDRPPHNHFDVELIAELADTYGGARRGSVGDARRAAEGSTDRSRR